MYARRIVLATGGRQGLPTDPAALAPHHRAKAMTSDFALTEAGQEQLAQKLQGAAAASAAATSSHILVNGGKSGVATTPVCERQSSYGSAGAAAVGPAGVGTGIASPAKALQVVSAERRKRSFGACSGTTTAAATAATASSSAPISGRATRLCIVGGSHSAFSTAWTCLYGLNIDEEVRSSIGDGFGSGGAGGGGGSGSGGCSGHGAPFGRSAIALIHRGAVKVYYASRSEAHRDGYNAIDAVNRQGQVQAFGGLRGDAKALYNQIRTGIETRARMYQAKDGGRALVEQIYEEAAAIVWACGYTTNTVPLHSTGGNGGCSSRQFELRREKGQVEVDDWA
ncbi:unnamed protein product, partial [Phaeothamnion confervicola]